MSNQHMEPGPPLYVQQLDEQIANTNALIRRLLEQADTEKKSLPFEVPSGGQTDASGNVKFTAFESPQGYITSIHRINLEAINPATGTSFTPAAPFTAGWVGIFRGDPGFGALLDFAPPNPGANVFPQISTDSDKQAAICRGEKIIVQVNAGPALSAIRCTLIVRVNQL